MLKIIKESEPIKVEQLVMVLYGAPGLGKSTLGFSADSPILLDFDKGAYRASNRKDSVPVSSWGDVASITAEDLKDYNSVVVDTAGRALDFLTTDIIKENPKMGYSGSLTLQGYGALKGLFVSWLKSLKVIGKDVILIAHSSEDKKGDDLIERLDVQGGSKGEIYKSADAMGRLYIDKGQRVLSFSPTDTAFGKNPGNIEPIKIPDISTNPDILSVIIHDIKTKLNTLTEEQQKRQSEIADWIAKIDESDTLGHFNKLVSGSESINKNISQIVKGAIHKAATDKGFIFNKGKYEVKA
jgi:hypothetical protein